MEYIEQIKRIHNDHTEEFIVFKEIKGHIVFLEKPCHIHTNEHRSGIIDSLNAKHNGDVFFVKKIINKYMPHEFLESIKSLDDGRVYNMGKYIGEVNKVNISYVNTIDRAFHDTLQLYSHDHEVKRYSSNGSLVEIGCYKNKKKDGEWVVYDSKGGILLEAKYENGVEISLKWGHDPEPFCQWAYDWVH